MGARGKGGRLSKIVKLNKRSAAGKIGRNAITAPSLPARTKREYFPPNIPENNYLQPQENSLSTVFKLRCLFLPPRKLRENENAFSSRFFLPLSLSLSLRVAKI